MPGFIDFAPPPSLQLPSQEPCPPHNTGERPYIYVQDFFTSANSPVSRALPLDTLSHFTFTATVYLL